MMERMSGMPEGTVGIRASGKLTREDYHQVLDPAIGEALDSGEMRMLFVLEDFDGLEPSAWLTDVKTGLKMEIGHRSDWKRFAFITNSDWVRKATHTFAWMIPGELMVGELDQLEQAKSWVAG